MLFCFFVPVYLYGQCESKIRSYANFQGSYLDGLSISNEKKLYGNIIDAQNAINGQVKDASTLIVPVSLFGSASATQFLEFTTQGTNSSKYLLPANTPVTIKFALPKELLGLLSAVEIGSFTNLHTVPQYLPILGEGNYAGFDATKNVIYNSANIANVLGSCGEVEITVTPHQVYNGIYVKIAGNVLSTGLSLKLFHAYVMDLGGASINCDEAIDVLSGVKPTNLGGIINSSGTVTNPFNVIDADSESYALMDVGTSIQNKVYLTTVYNNPSQPADSVRIVLQNPGGGLLDLNLLTDFTIQPYLDGIPAGQPFRNDGTLFNLRIIPGSSNKYSLTFLVSSAYNRLEITMGGTTAAFNKLKIFDIKRKQAIPRTLNSPSTNDSRVICEGNTTAFTVQNEQVCTVYNWYDAQTGGNLLYTGLTYDPGKLPVGKYNFYVQSSRTYCVTSVSDRLKVTLIVNPLPPLERTEVIMCTGTSTPIKILNADDNLYSYNWYSSSTNGTVINVGSTYTTPILNASVTYYVEATNKLTNCKNLGGLKAVSVTVKPYAIIPPIIGPNVICFNVTETLTNKNKSGKWTSRDANIATIDQSTGMVTAIGLGTTIISYTVDEDAINCGNNVVFNLTVNPEPNLTLASDQGICEGLTTTSMSYVNPVFEPITYSISWISNLLPNVSNQILEADTITVNIPPTTPVAIYHGILTIKNVNGCEHAIPFSFAVKLTPHKPIVSIN